MLTHSCRCGLSSPLINGYKFKYIRMYKAYIHPNGIQATAVYRVHTEKKDPTHEWLSLTKRQTSRLHIFFLVGSTLLAHISLVIIIAHGFLLFCFILFSCIFAVHSLSLDKQQITFKLTKKKMRDLGVYRWILHIYFDYVQIPEFFFVSLLF